MLKDNLNIRPTKLSAILKKKIDTFLILCNKCYEPNTTETSCIVYSF